MVEKYLLLTPGPLTTSEKVKQAMDFDYCTWDDDYKKITQSFRHSLLEVAQVNEDEYTAVPIQGSGTYGVESVISSTISNKDKLLIGINGAYGKRISEMADIYGLDHVDLVVDEREPITLELVTEYLNKYLDITHFAMIHCETTTGILNPIEDIIPYVSDKGIVTIVDAMSSFGGVPINVKEEKIDYLISSSNKCIQGVPGFSFVIARKKLLESTEGISRTLSLDLYGQYAEMERNNGKWRFTSPTHVVHAFYEALEELKAEGGVTARHQRYSSNQKHLASGMEELGFKVLIDEKNQSPIITSFIYPSDDFDFNEFYQQLKSDGFVIYPGKISQVPTFRIGNIGEVYDEDITKLLVAIDEIIN
ncbi:2-aminoethylphosphonate--pyruvate transaminase [Companilactobacillus crustorum]|uniref:2-aminoethylphosphonate--pyruvate transaminase n=3 Tax=Companilactobacillus TaxID=2767879 RepID=A0A837RJU3_9LACO|nr:2-aminoethylphosphonate--pyruvate transaminase [Companilactobacillus crustorum]KRK44167.1 2-aminoethylphosphonate--pyruvate transaminase [Companilactobacillus crustorum JCM 15951]KRO21542.1 2-aminoethylphosphonate--pyruvate transaminase [Companilactobacillus crustorum]GEO75701.1 2-aminoethylphosphonate--pyruvate transaminase [Companilactobacillus crustorum]